MISAFLIHLDGRTTQLSTERASPVIDLQVAQLPRSFKAWEALEDGPELIPNINLRFEVRDYDPLSRRWNYQEVK